MTTPQVPRQRRVRRSVAAALTTLAVLATTLIGAQPASALAIVTIEIDGVFLDGPMALNASSVNEMNTDLWDIGAIPNQEPYTALGYDWPNNNNFNNSGETVTTVPQVVDWVIVELRQRNDIDRVRSAEAAFLTVDGEIVNAQGGPLVMTTPGGIYNQFYVAVQHRNHLGYVSATPVVISNNTIDHTMGSIGLFGPANAHVVYTGGCQVRFGMVSGDATFDGAVNAADRSKVWNDRNQFPYEQSDLDLDGVVDADDRGIAWANRNIVQPYAS